MNKLEAKKRLTDYLAEHNISCSSHNVDSDHDIALIRMELPGYEKCPDQVLESCVYFYNSYMEVKVYFTESASNWFKEQKNNLSDIYRLLNVINAEIWLVTNEGIGAISNDSHRLLTPRFFLTEDGCYDLTATILLDYESYELTGDEIEEYFFSSIPELMNELSLPIFSVFFHKMLMDKGIEMIKQLVSSEGSFRRREIMNLKNFRA